MKNVKHEAWIWFQLGTFVLLWVGVLYGTGVGLEINWEALKKLPEVVTAYLILGWVFERWGWRWRVFCGWLVPLPDLEGTWRGTLQTSWRDASGAQPGPIPITVVIRQSFSRISCVMYSKESTSYSTAAVLAEDDDSGIIRLTYNYTNRPKADVRDRSGMHDGAVTFRVVSGDGTKAPALEGEYWTNRKTIGDMSVTFVSSKLERAFSEQGMESP